MADKWIPACPGIRYKEHSIRKHGKRPDRYWVLQYRRNNKTYNEAVGWWSQGANQAQCEELLAQLRQNWRKGQGPQTLREMQMAGQAAREAEARVQAQKEAEILTLAEFWERSYLPVAIARKKDWTLKGEKHLFKNWIGPVLGDMPLKEISKNDICKILTAMQNEGKAPRTQEHAKAVLSGIMSVAIEKEVLPGPNPCSGVKTPEYDNQRKRFLTPAEAKQLLDVLKIEAPQLHDEALLSMFCGLRFGEIAALTWGDVNFETRLLFVRDPKNTRSRYAYMTGEAKAMLKVRHSEQPHGALVFPGPDGRKQREVSTAFRRIIGELGFNEGRTDRRDQVVFHSLRHTYGSWLVQDGVPLYTTKDLMGHSTLAMTERYAHLAPDHLRKAADRLEGKLERN